MIRPLPGHAIAAVFLLAGLSACGDEASATRCESPNDLSGLTLQDCDGAPLPLTALSEHRAAWLFLYTGW